MLFSTHIEIDDWAAHYLKNSPDPVVLLEGKRKPEPRLLPCLAALSRQLASRFPQIIFRSGNAPGSDSAFMEPLLEMRHIRLQYVVPYHGHYARYIPPRARVYSPEDLSALDMERLREGILQIAPPLKENLDAYLPGKLKGAGINGAYFLRNAMKVAGAPELGLTPPAFAFFVDDENRPEAGGTGLTIRLARLWQVPFLKQQDWIDFLT